MLDLMYAHLRRTDNLSPDLDISNNPLSKSAVWEISVDHTGRANGCLVWFPRESQDITSGSNIFFWILGNIWKLVTEL